ncbi:hypothetical protein OOK58_38590 [Streptomyces sp. NBC_01728]|uniref:hypothetical protein n=1 Tax=unclassified Streptomyces TaxID=2593676 RepID=UPI0022531CBC|nr:MULTISPECIES: hypothetical protein [unclassified Streptomyces]MCX4457854.1 hypothetical protein [Streptomyces sp. NBC_01719]MCX4497211.1 hypothetical protein [Streptomyces sp. NBC_01728]
MTTGQPALTPAPDERTQQPEPTGSLRPADDSDLTTSRQTALASAQKRATASGTSVRVDALTTETATTTANPSGTLTYNSSLLPVRVHKAGRWVPVDSTLRRNADGTYSPKAAAEPLVLSGGGAAPLATMSKGKTSLALSWPKLLPAPHVSGASLTYPGVLPGVDLRVTADTQGGWSQVLIVKDAKAAANPALANLSLTTRAHGVTVTDDGHGNLAATAPDGRVLFSAPQPAMWDSSGIGAQHTAPENGPAPKARVARVQGRLHGRTLSLVPDARLLGDAHTRYPVFIDPTWNPHYASGAKQHYVETQQGCPTAKNYDSTQYGDPGVGYNSWSGCIGGERSYFQLAVPSAIDGAHVVSATVDVKENYSASCSLSSDVSLYWSGAINSSTTWNTKPSLTSKLATKNFGPACTSEPSGGFSVTDTIKKGAQVPWKSWTFALVNSQNGSGDGNYFKRFDNNPSMSIEYNHVPNKPGNLATKVGSTSLGCGTTTPYPIVGKTLATTPPTLNASVSDGDKDALSATYSYWVGSGSATTTTSATVSSGANAPKQLPSSFMSGLADGSVVSWKVTSTDGEDTSDPSATCHFTVDLHSPAQPTVTPADNLYPEDSPGKTAAGTPGQFTVSVDPGTNGNNAAKFLYGLDAEPPTSNTPTSQWTKANNNTATIRVTPVAPGTHTLYVYAVDSAGNVSSKQQYEFTALGHAPAPQPYTSLQEAFNNTATTDDSNHATGDADGVGATLSLQDLKAAGWQPGGKVTVDGATFTLPNFGSASGDNVMAANQTIKMNGASGQALVFLGFSTYGSVGSRHQNGDSTSPVVPNNTNTSATNCSLGNGTYEDCTTPIGSLTYGDGTAQPYYLTMPDWISGSDALAAVTLLHRNTPSIHETRNTNIYAFAVPLKAGATLNSVTLPDVADAARRYVPGMHIIGMSVRDTATAPGGATWTGTWGAPTEERFQLSSMGAFSNQTLRMITQTSAGGDNVRLRLSNALGTDPLTLDHVTVAYYSSGAVTTSTPVDVTFNGSKSVVIPEGGELYSDPIPMQVVPGVSLTTSMHLVNQVNYLVMHPWAAPDTLGYVSAVGSGDHTKDTAATAFTGTGTVSGRFSDILTEVDVTTTDHRPAVSVLGDGLINTRTSGTTAGYQTLRYNNDLSIRLRTNTEGIPVYGVVASGIENNYLGTDQGAGAGGRAVLTRLDRDVLSIPGLRTVVVTQGLEDIVAGHDDVDIDNALGLLRDQLRGWGIRVIFTTLTPCHGYSPCTAAIDQNRIDTNTWITDQSDPIKPSLSNIDAESAIAIQDPASTTDPPALMLDADTAPLDFDSGDHVNLTSDGYQTISNAFDLASLGPDA